MDQLLQIEVRVLQQYCTVVCTNCTFLSLSSSGSPSGLASPRLLLDCWLSREWIRFVFLLYNSTVVCTVICKCKWKAVNLSSNFKHGYLKCITGLCHRMNNCYLCFKRLYHKNGLFKMMADFEAKCPTELL